MINIILGRLFSRDLCYDFKQINFLNIDEFFNNLKQASDFNRLKIIYIFDEIYFHKYIIDKNNNINEQKINKKIFDFEIEQIKNLENNNYELPLCSVFYHATTIDNFESIRKNGLGFDTSNKLWDVEYEQPNIGVFLANDEDIAYNFVETSDYYNNDEIIIFEIPLKYLNISNLFIDSNVIDNLTGNEPISTWFYDDIIPFEKLKIIEL